MAADVVNVMIGGEAGQGLATVGQVLAKALVTGGWGVVVTQSYHSRIRGGHNTMSVRAASRPISAPQEEVDLLVALNQQTIDLHVEELAPGGLVISDEGLKADGARHLKAPFSELATGRFSNVAALGVAGALLGLGLEQAVGGLEKFLGKKPDDVMAKNRKALADAYAWAEARNEPFEPLGKPAYSGKRLMMQGNEAIALGAMSAGVKFCSFYPMTPATSIALTLAANARRMGLVVEQAEDEIAAINMALGASFAGAPAIAPTSGGGFALMTEGLSLAGISETPVLVVISQRPGPATGLPTRTEQGDLEFALHGGHGEFPRAVFAPGDMEECFHLTRRALQTAEEYQTPVILLTDQFMADSFRSVEPFDLGSLEPVALPKTPAKVSEPYERYALTKNGISPRLLPGAGPHLVLADSDEHTPDGHITEDLSVRVQMNEKRLAKLAGMRGGAIAPQQGGADKPELVLVCWGSAKDSVMEAAEQMTTRGRPTAWVHFSQLWPLDVNQFAPGLKAAARLICVEGNATGQFARLLRREAGLEMDGMVLRYDGLPITPEYIQRQLADF